MRILRVAQKVYPDVKGGGSYHVHAMSRDQAAMGHDVTVLTVRQNDSLPYLEERDGYTVVRYDPSLNLLGNDISSGVAQYLHSMDRFDVIHAHSHLYFSTNLAAVKRFFSDIPLAITNHGLFSQNAPEWVFDLYLRSAGRWTFNQADVVFCYTETDKHRVQEFGVSSRVKVVSNGIDTERFSPTGSKSKLIDADGPVILFVGRLTKGKRPELAIEAFARILHAYPNAEMYICGKGTLRTDLEEKADRLGIESRITFLGQVPYREMPAVYRSANALVLPSRAEGVPRTIMEALASGLPVVSSSLPQIRSAFEDSVAYAECGDESAFAERLKTILDRDPTTELSDQFKWEKTVKETTNQLAKITKM